MEHFESLPVLAADDLIKKLAPRGGGGGDWILKLHFRG